jgi:C1A family cysteine protease
MSKEVLDKHWQELRKLPNVLNVAVAPKFKDGKPTGETGITVYVSNKVKGLPSHLMVPKKIEGVATDVVEFAPKTWHPGVTSISKLHPEQQLRRLGAREPKRPKATTVREITATKLESSWKPYCSPIRDQGNCGSCVGEGCIGHIEIQYRIAGKKPNDPILLSIAQPFFCCGGTCEGGSDPSTLLSWLQANGVCPESYLPYDNHVYAGNDEVCNYGIKPGWQNNLTKISGWQELADINAIRQALMSGSLIAVMAVHQSFFSYQSGVYRSLGNQDPVVGYHCVVNIGGHDSIQAYDVRNSWGTGWGQAGYFQIAYGDSEFDTSGWLAVPITPQPSPPPPTPVPSTGVIPVGACVVQMNGKDNPAQIYGYGTWKLLRRCPYGPYYWQRTS